MDDTQLLLNIHAVLVSVLLSLGNHKPRRCSSIWPRWMLQRLRNLGGSLLRKCALYWM